MEIEEDVLRFGKKVFHRFKCQNIHCKKVFFRTAREVKAGAEQQFCSKSCRLNGVSDEETLLRQIPKTNCSLCGLAVKRAPSAIKRVQDVYCSEFCMRTHQAVKKSVDQVVYTTDLLQHMSKSINPWTCAFPGCDRLQARGKLPTYKNPYHACSLHRERIKNALKQRGKMRRKLLLAHVGELDRKINKENEDG